MALFFPEWIPWWLQLVIVGIIVVFGLCFLLMPFSVFGLKSRLTYLDHQMEDIQSQLRVLLKRIPDARERLEFKLQPISTGEGDGVRANAATKGKNLTNSSSDYYAAVPSTKNRPICFDPPSEPGIAPVRSPVKTVAYEDERQSSAQDRSRDREPISEQEKRVVVSSGRREEQIYNPPIKSVREERQEEPQPRRRAEPILRWPPR